MTKKELTKEKIRTAAYKCVARFGFEKTTLDDIAGEVGLNKASLYYYYKNKEDIFLEITSEATRRFEETLQNSTLAVRGGISAEVRHFLVERAVYYLRMTAEIHISEEALRQVEHLFWEQIKDVEAREVQFLTGRLNAATVAGHLKKTDTILLARNLIVLSEGIKRSVKERHAESTDLEQMRAEIAGNLNFMLGLIWNGLQTP